MLGFASTLSMITYLDRVCFSTVAPAIQREFSLTDFQKGLLFSAFTLAYATFEVPSGWLGDVFGPRRTLIRIVIWWSLFTALTGAIYPVENRLQQGFALLLAVRFLFGMGEAGAYPNIARAFHNWFPFQERGFAQGTVWMAGRFAGGMTHLVVLALVTNTVDSTGNSVVYWRHTFWIFGAIGLLWCTGFWSWFQDHPEQKGSVNPAELELIRQGQLEEAARARVPWLTLLTSWNLWLLCLMYFCGSYGWYFNITWLPGYLERYFQVTPQSQGLLASGLLPGAPLLIGAPACFVGGMLSDAFIRRTGDRKWGRRLFGVLGHGACAVCYFLSLFALDPRMFVAAIALGTFFNDLTMGAAWASCLDIGGRYSGIVAGCMNTIGNLGGFVASLATGWILERYGADAGNARGLGWQISFISYAAAYVVAALLWLWFDATRPVVPSGKTS